MADDHATGPGDDVAPPEPPEGWGPPPFPPVEPTEPSQFAFGEVPSAADDLVGIGADLAPATVLGAYRRGLFPMHVEGLGARVGRRRTLGWWSPDPRGVIPLDDLRVSRSLRRSCRQYAVTVDQAFDDVVAGCGDPSRDGAWINDEIAEAYRELHQMGWVHSVETWDRAGELVGGLYGVAVGGLFAGESMFHTATDASKVALVTLVDRLRSGGCALLDTQWATPHLASLGAVEMARSEYLALVSEAVALPQMTAFVPGP